MTFQSVNDAPIIVASREKSSMASTWTVYLCLERGRNRKFLIFTGMYEALDEAEKYYDEEAEEIVLPKEIGGKVVVGIDDDWVVGGSIGFTESEDAIEVDEPNDPNLTDWLKSQGWINYEASLLDVMKKLASSD